MTGGLDGLPGETVITDDLPGAFAGAVADAFAARPGGDEAVFSLVLSGGPTARSCYQRLAAEADRLDWSRVDLLMGDERCVPPDDPDANQRMVREALVDQVGPVHRFAPMDCAAGPAAYQSLVGAYRAFDVVHLGLGPCGHTASLFPDAPALAAPPGVLVTFDADPHGRNPHRRMTFTYAAIARARLVLFTVAGPSKRAALGAVAAGAALPAARVRAGRVRWLVDRAASG